MKDIGGVGRTRLHRWTTETSAPWPGSGRPSKKTAATEDGGQRMSRDEVAADDVDYFSFFFLGKYCSMKPLNCV